jgi:hypothetical protein
MSAQQQRSTALNALSPMIQIFIQGLASSGWSFSFRYGRETCMVEAVQGVERRRANGKTPTDAVSSLAVQFGCQLQCTR